MTMRGWSEMVVESILRRARALGIKLEAAGEYIRYAPKSLAPEDFVESLRKHKPEILSYLARDTEGCLKDGTSDLLAWARNLAVRDLVLSCPVRFVETPLRVITTSRVSQYATQYLTTIGRARTALPDSGWGRFTPQWWKEQEGEALSALASLRKAMAEQGDRGGLS
jgi:hypothetical protein